MESVNILHVNPRTRRREIIMPRRGRYSFIDTAEAGEEEGGTMKRRKHSKRNPRAAKARKAHKAKRLGLKGVRRAMRAAQKKATKFAKRLKKMGSKATHRTKKHRKGGKRVSSKAKKHRKGATRKTKRTKKHAAPVVATPKPRKKHRKARRVAHKAHKAHKARKAPKVRTVTRTITKQAKIPVRKIEDIARAAVRSRKFTAKLNPRKNIGLDVASVMVTGLLARGLGIVCRQVVTAIAKPQSMDVKTVLNLIKDGQEAQVKAAFEQNGWGKTKEWIFIFRDLLSQGIVFTASTSKWGKRQVNKGKKLPMVGPMMNKFQMGAGLNLGFSVANTIYKYVKKEIELPTTVKGLRTYLPAGAPLGPDSDIGEGAADDDNPLD